MRVSGTMPKNSPAGKRKIFVFFSALAFQRSVIVGPLSIRNSLSSMDSSKQR